MKRLIRHLAQYALCFAALSVVSAAAAAGVNVELATADEKRDATTEYKAGMKAFDENNHAEALDHFHKSFDIVASPNSQLMIARALVHLDRLSEAHSELMQVIELASALARSNPKYQSTADAAQKELSELQPKIALVTVSVPVSLSVNGNAIPPAQWGKPLALSPGKAAFQLQASDKSAERTLELSAGDNQQISLDLPKEAPLAPAPVVAAPPEHKTSTKRTVGYVAVGAGGAGLLVSTVVLLISQGQVAKIVDSCSNRSCPLTVTDDADSARRRETVALVGIGVGIVGVAAGGYLILTSGNEPTNSAQPGSSQASRTRTALRVGANGIQVWSQF